MGDERITDDHPNGGSRQKQLVLPGQFLCSADGVLRGHGTFERDGKVRASVYGVAETVSKLILVRVVGNSRYTPEVGDVVVGRIDQVGLDRWLVDIRSHQRGQLHLSGTHLLSGEQRRRTATDQLDMKKLYQENDLVCLEVQRVSNDGQALLHARNTRYGMLRNGSVTVVPPSLVPRQPNHMFTLKGAGVYVVLGMNGYIWAGHPPEVSREDTLNFVVRQSKDICVPVETRAKVARTQNIVAAMAANHIPIIGETIERLFQDTVAKNLSARDLLDPDTQTKLCASLDKK